jgi:hypothetical protein
LLKTSARSVERAKTIQKQGSPELVAAVEAGDIGVTPAAEIAKLPKDKQIRAMINRKGTALRPRKPAVITTLNSLAWSRATEAERTRFVSDVGLASIWKAANDDQRSALEKAIDAETQSYAVLA